MLTRRMLSNFDLGLFLAVLVLTLLSLLFIYSSTFDSPAAGYWKRQLVWLLAGLVLFALTLYFDYHIYAHAGPVLYFISLLILVLVLFFGKSIHGTKSWLVLGPFNIQPSELVKFIIAILLARYFSASEKEHLELNELLVGSFILLPPLSLVLAQGDVGTALTLLPPFILLAYLGGVKRWLVVWAVVLLLLAAPLVWFSLKDYHRQRVMAVIDPQSADTRGIGYQSIQSKIALGSGKLFGKGLKQGSQSRLGFLPGKHTDFIFAVLAEETGFLGASFVLALYLFIFLRMIAIARDAKDKLGMMLVGGVLSIFMFHAIINIGMVLGLIPIIGIPLPFMSYGGSSILASFLALGLVMNVGMRRYIN